MYLNPVPKSATPALPSNDKGNYLPISPVVFGLVILALLVVTTVVKKVSSSDNGRKIQQRMLKQKKKNSKISEQRSMKEAEGSHTQELSSGVSRKSLSEGDSGKSPKVDTSSKHSSVLSDEEDSTTCWNKMRCLLCPWSLPRREPSIKTVPSTDSLSDEFEYVVEKLLIKKVPLSLCGTKEDLRQRHDERSRLRSLCRESSVPKALTGTEYIGDSMHSSESEPGNIIQELSPATHTSMYSYTKTEIPFNSFYENQVNREEKIVKSSFLNSPARSNYNSDIPLPVVQPLVPQNASHATIFPVWAETTSSHESKYKQDTPQSDRSFYYDSNQYSAPMADSVPTETEHAAGSRFKTNAPRKSIGHDGKYRAKPGQHSTDGNVSRAQERFSKCFDVGNPPEMSSMKNSPLFSNFKDPNNLSIKSKNEVDYPMQPKYSRSNETVENESMSNSSSGSDTGTSSVVTSKSVTPERRISTSNRSLSSIKGSDILYEEDKELTYSDDDEDKPVYVSVDGKRVFQTEKDKHDFLNQFNSIFVENLKDPIPKDPNTLKKKDTRSQLPSRDNKSRISLPELLSEIGSTKVKSVPAGARNGGIFTNKSKPVVSQYVSETQTDRSTSDNHAIITEDLQSSEMLSAPLNTFSPATSAGYAHSDLVQVVEIQLGPDKASGTTLLTSLPQIQGPFKNASRQNSIKGHPNEAIPSSHMASDTRTNYSMTSSNKKQTNNDLILSNEAETCNKRTVSFIGSTPNTEEDETKQIESPKTICYNIQRNQPRMISQIKNESKEEDELFLPTSSEYIERLHEYPSHETAFSANESTSSSNQSDAEIVISPQNVQLKGSACLLDPNDSLSSVDSDHARPVQAMPQNTCGISSASGAFEVESDHSRDQELDKSPVHVPPQRLHICQRGHTSGAPSANIPATGTEYPLQAGRNRFRSNALDTSSRTSIGHRTQQDLSSNSRDSAERGSTLRWKIIIKHHRDAPEEQPPKNKTKDILPSNDDES